MGFSLELYFEELQQMLGLDIPLADKLFMIKNHTEKAKRYAQECNMLPKDLPPFMPELMDLDLFYVFDTETTGFAKDAEVCQLGVINSRLDTEIESFVKIKGKIPKEAYAIHHISDLQCKEYGRAWSIVFAEFCRLTLDKHVVAWNLAYDLRLLRQTCEIHDVDYSDFKPAGVHCAMQHYAKYHDIERGREKLATAVENHDIPYVNSHSAIGDCVMTLEVINKVWYPNL